MEVTDDFTRRSPRIMRESLNPLLPKIHVGRRAQRIARRLRPAEITSVSFQPD